MILREGSTPPPTRVYSMSLAPLLTPSWGHPRPSSALAGLFKPILKQTWHPSCLLRAFNATTRPPNNNFASYPEALGFQSLAKNVDFALFFFVFTTFAISAFQSPKPRICLKMPPWTPKKGPRRPTMAQDGPKMGSGRGRGTSMKPRILIPGALLGLSWATSGLQKALGFLCSCYFPISLLI